MATKQASKQATKGKQAKESRPAQADERTRRRAGEKAGGGESSQETAKRYAAGKKPAGTHQKGAAVPRPNPYEEVGLKNQKDETPEE